MSKVEDLKKREQALVDREKLLSQRLSERREAVFSRFPLVFTLLGSFGLVATFYGFERLIDEVPALSDNPLILLATGLTILIITGSLYKKLQ